MHFPTYLGEKFKNKKQKIIRVLIRSKLHYSYWINTLEKILDVIF